MNRVIDEFKARQRAERLYRDKVRAMPSDALATEHAQKMKRYRALKKIGTAADSAILSELRTETKALADEIRKRATTRGGMDGARRALNI